MPDELPVPPDGAPEAPTTPDPSVDYEKRWKDTHANWNTLNEQLSRFKQDPNALIEFIQENHPDLIAGDEEPDEEDEPDLEPDEDERPMTVAEFKAYQKEQAEERQQQSRQQQYETDLKTFINGRDLDEFGERAIRGTPVKSAEELKATVDKWFEREEARSSTPKPRVPHVATNGTAATGEPDWSKMSQGDINRYMAERVRGHQAQT